MRTPPGSVVLILVLACHEPPAAGPVSADGSPPDLGIDSRDGQPDPGPAAPPYNRCAAVGCALIPECPGTCQSECGCCPCGPGYQTCTWREGRAALQACGPTGGCWNYTLCPAQGGCVEPEHGKAVCVSSYADCPRIEAAYLREVQSYANLVARPGPGAPTANPDRSCYSDESCQVTPGHCSIGLGACWYVGRLEPAVLQDLASLWVKLGCAGPVSCNCTPLPTRAECPQSGGNCVVR
jgi:hypothetical protein